MRELRKSPEEDFNEDISTVAALHGSDLKQKKVSRPIHPDLNFSSIGLEVIRLKIISLKSDL